MFALDAAPQECGQFATEVRIYPWHELLSHPYELGLDEMALTARPPAIMFAKFELRSLRVPAFLGFSTCNNEAVAATCLDSPREPHPDAT